MSAPQQASVSPLPEWITDSNYTAPPGHLGNLTITQQHCLDKLKKELKEEGHFVEGRMDDAYLLRFCRARKFDYPKVKEMLLAAEAWRKELNVDEIAKNQSLETSNRLYPQYYHKVDKDGRPIYIEQLGQLDVSKLDPVKDQKLQVERLVYEYEKSLNTRIKVCSQQSGHPVETFCTILDLQGVGISGFYTVKAFVQEAAKIGQDRYPETMGKFYILNAPWAFKAIWSIIKGWLDPVTVAKIEVLGGPSDYKPVLLKQIAPENLPTAFGGTCQCVGGCATSDAGPWRDVAKPAATTTAEPPAPAAS